MGTSISQYVTGKITSIKTSITACRNMLKLFRGVYSATSKITNEKGEIDSDALLDTLKTSDSIPETYRHVLKSVDQGAFKSVFKSIYDSLSKSAEIGNSPFAPPEEKTETETENPQPLEDTPKQEDPVDRLDGTTQVSDDDEEATVMQAKRREYQQDEGGRVGNSTFDNMGFEKPGSSSTQPGPPKNLSAMHRMLDEQLTKMAGPNWRQRVPGFVKNPPKEAPDLGFGLDPQANKAMVNAISKVISPIM